MTNQPTYSIIIPHKNTPDLLLRLLKTIPGEDLCEAIVVDDDSSEEHKAHSLFQNDKWANVKFIFGESFNGAGSARNIGLKYASGKFIIFADADDIFHSNAATILTEYIGSEVDVIYCNIDSFYNTSSTPASRHEKYSILFEKHQNGEIELEELKYRFTPPWSKIINKQLIDKNSLSFEEIPASNDIMFSTKLAYFSNKTAVDNRIFYSISVTEGSITNKFNQRNFDSKLNAAIRVNNFLRSVKKNKYQHSILYFVAKSYKFGSNYSFQVLSVLIKNKSNPLIGLHKLLNLRKTLENREKKF